MKYAYGFGLTAAFAAPASAAAIDMTVTIPKLNVAEYHRPYVAIWLERTGASNITNLSIWYDSDMRNNEGTKWLRDVRQWWRKTGRTLKHPVSGITGATRAPGPQKISFGPDRVGKLAPGNYELVVEAAREVGGRELLRMPFTWPVKGATTVRASGEHELGAVVATIKP
ncbi:MAG: DUF2271 domain-containing protein [Sphingomonadaceae bacterium]